MGGRLAAGFGFKLVYLYTAELFPTAIRNTAIGSNSTAGRVGYRVSKSRVINLLKKIPLFFVTALIFSGFLYFFIIFFARLPIIFFTWGHLKFKKNAKMIPCLKIPIPKLYLYNWMMPLISVLEILGWGPP